MLSGQHVVSSPADCSHLTSMRYRLTIIAVVVAAIGAAVVMLILTTGEDPSVERDATSSDVFSPELGIVAAFTATARAGGGALDPTALVTPTTVLAAASPVIPDPTSTKEPEPDRKPEPQLSAPTNPVSAGQSISVRLTGAAPGEQFDNLIKGESAVVSGIADETGSAVIALTVPIDIPAGTAVISFSGESSGSTSISIQISVVSPSITLSPDSPAAGDSITVVVEGLTPAEAVTVRISGELVGSAISGSDGSFSITTRVPELESGEHTVSLEDESGEIATAKLMVAAGSESGSANPTTTPVATGAIGDGSEQTGPDPSSETDERQTGGAVQETPGNDQSQGDQPSEVGDQAAGADIDSATGPDGSGLPPWLYVIIGVFTGWLGLLTVWVIRLDRSRDRRIDALTQGITRLVGSEEADTGLGERATTGIPHVPAREDLIA